MHPSDVEWLIAQLNALVESGNTVIVVDHDMGLAAASDWIIDIEPAAGDEGGRIVASGKPEQIVLAVDSRTAPYLKRVLSPNLQSSQSNHQH